MHPFAVARSHTGMPFPRLALVLALAPNLHFHSFRNGRFLRLDETRVIRRCRIAQRIFFAPLMHQVLGDLRDHGSGLHCFFQREQLVQREKFPEVVDQDQFTVDLHPSLD